MNEYIQEKELPPIKDKIQQIFKFLEIADVSQWQGMNVFEAGDSDSLYGILATAFEQVEQDAYKRAVEIVKAIPFGQSGNNDYDRGWDDSRRCAKSSIESLIK